MPLAPINSNYDEQKEILNRNYLKKKDFLFNRETKVTF